MFAGVGIGIVGAGTLVPLLLRGGWYGLARAGRAGPAAHARGLDAAGPTTRRCPGRPPATGSSRAGRSSPWSAIYMPCSRWASCPHMVFFVDFIARGLGWGVTVGRRVLGGLRPRRDRRPVRRRLARRPDRLRPRAVGGAGAAAGRGADPAAGPFALPLALSALVMGAFTPGHADPGPGPARRDRRRPRPARRLGPRHHGLRAGPGRRRLRHVLALRPQPRLHALFEAGAVALAAALALSLAPGGGRRRG